MHFIDLKAQYDFLKEQINRRIQVVLDHGHYIMGPEVGELEEKLADYVGVDHCISCANGTDALQLLLMAYGIGPGDAVFAPAFTFFATAEVIALVGATPVFVDVDAETYNICTEKLESEVNRIKREGRLNAKAIIAVDLFGQPANYDKLELVAKQQELLLIEDGAQGFGGTIRGRKACSFGDVATTSFFPAKPLGCYGDGGAIFTNDKDLASVLRSLRVHGQGVDKYDNIRIGLNSRLDTIQAAILLEKLAEFPIELAKRQDIASYYKSNIKANLIFPLVPNGFSSSWAQFTLRVHDEDNRARYQEALKASGIPSAIYYGKSLDQQFSLKSICEKGELSVTHSLAKQVFSIPMHPYLTLEQTDKIVQVLNGVDR